MMTNEQKQAIVAALKEYIKRYPSQNKAATSLKGISAATLSNIINGNWTNISDAMFQRLGAQVSSRDGEGWKICKTSAFKALSAYMQDCKDNSNVMWVVGPAGIGKSTAAQIFTEENSNVYLMTCSNDMTKSDFIRELASKIGVRTKGCSLRETLLLIISELVKKDSPLLIFDEGDKLADSVLYYYINLYNGLEDRCGMVFLSTNYIADRMRKGLSRGKKGYDEIDSRICRRFVQLDLINSNEVEEISMNNGLTNEKSIAIVKRESAECGNDLRRVKKSVHKELRKLAFSEVQ